MYGLVNQGIKDLVISKFGEETWRSLCIDCGSPEEFISMQYYDDAITYSLVGAASKKLGLDASKVLEEFGKHWVKYTAQEGYGPIMDLFGSDFKTCLQNLNHLHTRMGMSLPHLKPPSFIFTEIDEKTFHLEYISERKGLGPMVLGLLNGLATKYGVSAFIEQITDENDTGPVKFRIDMR